MTHFIITSHSITGRLGAGLSQRELECVMAVASGMTSKEVSRNLGISKDGVDKRILAAGVKLGVVKRAALVAEAFKRGLIAFAGAANPTPEGHENADGHNGILIA